MEPGGAIRDDSGSGTTRANSRSKPTSVVTIFGGHIVRTKQRPWATRHTYRYDDRGNWIERISATGVLPDGPYDMRRRPPGAELLPLTTATEPICPPARRWPWWR
jgi:hypothetical protein